jgi:uncharacterized protein with PIN domain
MRFLLDMNLPPALAEWLRSEGHDAVHIREIGLAHLPDREVFARAAEEGRIVVTPAFASGGCRQGVEGEMAERVERRLAAILAADVAGYSRLIGADEEGTSG